MYILTWKSLKLNIMNTKIRLVVSLHRQVDHHPWIHDMMKLTSITVTFYPVDGIVIHVSTLP